MTTSGMINPISGQVQIHLWKRPLQKLREERLAHTILKTTYIKTDLCRQTEQRFFCSCFIILCLKYMPLFESALIFVISRPEGGEFDERSDQAG